VVSLPGGSVSIGGVQTGVSASAGPSGWNTIGGTAMTFFDPSRDKPAVLAPGDMIRFRVERIVK
jgi:allophanate hydrolase subunit 1